MRTRTPEIDSKIIELYQVQGQHLATVAETIGWSQVTTYRRIRELGICRDRATINKMLSESLMGHPVSEKVRQAISEKEKGRHTSPQTEFKKGQVPWNKGKKMSPEMIQKCSESHKGKPSWNKGVPMHKWMSEKSNEMRKNKIKINNPRYWLDKKRPELYADSVAREKQAALTALSWQNPIIRQKRIDRILEVQASSEYKHNHNQGMKRMWADSDHRAERISAVVKALVKHPTKPEQRIIDVTQKYELPYAYTGDGSTIICGLNPDFVNCNGAKKIIEVFGVVFHDPSKTFREKIPLSQQELYRKSLYASLGFDCLVLWDTEIAKLSDKEIATRIRKFNKSKHKATSQLRFKEVM